MVRRYALRATGLALASAFSLGAQGNRTPIRASVTPNGRVTALCAGQRIDSIFVYPEAPTVSGLQRVPALAALARQIHATTRPEVIKRYLLLQPGDACSEIRRAESERILRAQSFIAESDVFAVLNDSGGVDLEVHTTDETSIVFGGSVRARSPMLTSVLAGNANIGGEGVFGSVGWRYGEGFRSAVSARVTDNQFLGEPMIATIEGERAQLGGTWRTELMHPFLTDLQTVAWHTQAGNSKTFVELRRPDGVRPSVMLMRQYFDAGAIARLGPPGRFLLMGGSITSDDESSGQRLTTSDTGVITDVGVLPRTYASHRVARLNLLAGVRNISFVRRVGLDALTSVQDVPVGVQLGGLIGRTVRGLGSRDDDTFISGDLYAGATSMLGIVRLQARGEARRELGANQWDGVLSTARLTHTLQFSWWHENQVRLEWSSTWRQRTPFQLLFGMPEGGVRGFEESSLAGGQRFVGRIDERFVLGRPFNLADVGVALFTDVGRQWAGDVPFGRTTPVKGSVGIGLLAAVPPRSGRLWRADLALPLGSDAGARWTITVSNYDRSSFVFREPNDVNDAREPTVPRSIFTWP